MTTRTLDNLKGIVFITTTLVYMVGGLFITLLCAGMGEIGMKWQAATLFIAVVFLGWQGVKAVLNWTLR